MKYSDMYTEMLFCSVLFWTGLDWTGLVWPFKLMAEDLRWAAVVQGRREVMRQGIYSPYPSKMCKIQKPMRRKGHTVYVALKQVVVSS